MGETFEQQQQRQSTNAAPVDHSRGELLLVYWHETMCNSLSKKFQNVMALCFIAISCCKGLEHQAEGSISDALTKLVDSLSKFRG